MKTLLRLFPLFAPLAAAVVTGLCAAPVLAQTYPARPVRAILGYPAGIASDIASRALATEMNKRLANPIIIENRPGANGGIAANAVKDAPPDGYIIYSGGMTHLHPVLTKVNPITAGRDLSAIADFAALPLFVLARTSLGVKSLQELVAYSKANPPGKITFGSLSAMLDLMLGDISSKTGLTYTTVPFKSVPATDMLNGDVDIIISSLIGLVPHIQSGKIIALVGSRKLDPTPNTPVSTELGLSPIPEARLGMWGPPALSAEIRQRLASELALAVKTQEVIGQWQKLSLVNVPSTSEDQQKTYDNDIGFFRSAAQRTNFQPQ